MRVPSGDVDSIPYQQQAGAALAGIRAVAEFSETRILHVIRTQQKKSDYEEAIASTYYRMHLWAVALARLTDAKDFQVAQCGCRSMFELRIDLELLKRHPEDIAKYYAFVEVERFRSAKNLVDFLNTNPTVNQGSYQPQIKYMADPQRTTQIEALVDKHWGRDKNGKLLWPSHWTNRDLYGRTAILGTEFEELYRSEYPRGSWFVHPGATGILGLSADGFFCALGVGIMSAKNVFVGGIRTAGDIFQVFKAQPICLDELKVAAAMDGKAVFELLAQQENGA